jgi:hypothetical protein
MSDEQREPLIENEDTNMEDTTSNQNNTEQKVEDTAGDKKNETISK